MQIRCHPGTWTCTRTQPHTLIWIQNKYPLLYVLFSSVTVFNPCNSTPCSNGGTCTKTGQGYQCSCSRNYEGTTCTSGYYYVWTYVCRNYILTVWFQQIPLIAKIHSCNTGYKRHTRTCTRARTRRDTQEHAHANQHIQIWSHNKYVLLDILFTYVTAFNPCNPNPCSHGGTCAKTGQGYHCYCSSSYKGKTCNSGYYCVLSVCKL